MNNKTVTIERVEGGFVLKWEGAYDPNNPGVNLSNLNGTEVHTTFENVLGSAKVHLS